MCTGTFREGDGTPRAPYGSKCTSECVNEKGRWGSSWCYTGEDKSQWGAECIACKNHIQFLSSCFMELFGKNKMHKISCHF